VGQRVFASVSCLGPEGPEDDEGDCDVRHEPCSASPTLRSSGALGWWTLPPEIFAPGPVASVPLAPYRRERSLGAAPGEGDARPIKRVVVDDGDQGGGRL